MDYKINTSSSEAMRLFFQIAETSTGVPRDRQSQANEMESLLDREDNLSPGVTAILLILIHAYRWRA